MKQDNRNLNQYHLKNILLDVDLLDKIRTNLMAVSRETFIGGVIAYGAEKDCPTCIKMIREYYEANPKSMITVVGRETLQMIERLLDISFADDLIDVFN